ncbi:hypothetical protein H6P81_005513 [Aristolochia fimbriata]|uniref:Uncharacterized protein n=1 Tax=Aristolochia fimbriata TaxID=158543 RepID=A0AAV7EVD6_ARIFI|nr:hypothetical protein H6P81_005513 [Aristolochia fimbriata]
MTRDSRVSPTFWEPTPSQQNLPLLSFSPSLICLGSDTLSSLKNQGSMAATLGVFLCSPNLSPKNFTLSPSIVSASSSSPRRPLKSTKTHFDDNPEKVLRHFSRAVSNLSISPLPTAAALSFPFLLFPQDVLAAEGEFGLLEGRTFALIHPIIMSGLFVYTLWAGYLGWQWRRVRTIQDEINELKKQVKPAAVAGEGAAEAAAAPVSPLETKIQELTEERKKLLKGSYRDRHFNAGSILLGFGVLEAVGGGLNTWLRTGKLFPGPHLFAGATITVLWAAAAALVPSMQKGSETARSLHIALNTLNVILFVWQIPTGFDIVLKVFEFTKWP